MYTGYRQEDVPFHAIDMIHAFKVSTRARTFASPITYWNTATIRTEHRVQPMYLSSQGLVSLESVQAPVAQPLDQAYDRRSPDPQWCLHGRHNNRLSDSVSSCSQVMGPEHPGRLLQSDSVRDWQRLGRDHHRLPRLAVNASSAPF